MKFTPIYLNKKHNVKYVFPRLYVDNKEDAMNVGQTVEEKQNDEMMEFTGRVIDLDEIIYDDTKKRILAPFTYGDSKELVLILDKED